MAAPPGECGCVGRPSGARQGPRPAMSPSRPKTPLPQISGAGLIEPSRNGSIGSQYPKDRSARIVPSVEQRRCIEGHRRSQSDSPGPRLRVHGLSEVVPSASVGLLSDIRFAAANPEETDFAQLQARSRTRMPAGDESSREAFAWAKRRPLVRSAEWARQIVSVDGRLRWNERTAGTTFSQWKP